MISDKYSEMVIQKYGLPKNWQWSRLSRQDVENGILVTGKCKTIHTGQSIEYLCQKTYFISDDELVKSNEVTE